ncbi:uncharacterized protein LOC112178393 [Rosa chinensis]|uniref:uncharacterized protein LOC112178393 n=1 Tax=Rosa chinensis TaxID=74649 RepID=UPI000D08F606|nr:uncharacterized protein LOC112178393 [Rosa chinensis]
MSHRARKRYARANHPKEVCNIRYERYAKLPRFGWEPITFSEGEEHGVHLPHDDPFLIDTILDKWSVGRVFVDSGSAVNGCYNQLQRNRKLLEDHEPLLSFSGDVTQPLSSDYMRLSIGASPCTAEFPTPNGTRCVKGSQQLARECYSTTVTRSMRRHEILTVGNHLPLTNKIDDPRDDEKKYVKKEPVNPETSLQVISVSDKHPERTVRIGAQLSPEIATEFTQFLQDNVVMFVWSYANMPGISPNIITHKLSIKSSFYPIKQKRRTFDEERYHPSRKWQMCVDFKGLNKACPKDSFPLPRIDQLVDTTAGHDLLSMMDDFSRYNQIKMKPSDQKCTTFTTDKGLYCYNDMPLGLKNAGATYQRLMNAMFAEHLSKLIENPEHSGRLNKWAIELSEFNIEYKPCTAIKGQAVADFNAELTKRQDEPTIGAEESNTTMTTTEEPTSKQQS